MLELQANADVNSPQLLELLKTRFEEQTKKIETAVREAEERMLRSLMDRLDKIAGEVKQMVARVLTLEREVADLRSMRDRMGENLQAAGERLGALEARLATQCRETSSCDLRVHGVPYVEDEDLRALYYKLCFNLQLTPPPKVCDIFRARKSQHPLEAVHKGQVGHPGGTDFGPKVERSSGPCAKGE